MALNWLALKDWQDWFKRRPSAKLTFRNDGVEIRSQGLADDEISRLLRAAKRVKLDTTLRSKPLSTTVGANGDASMNLRCQACGDCTISSVTREWLEDAQRNNAKVEWTCASCKETQYVVFSRDALS